MNNEIDAYIAKFPAATQERLQQVRATIQAAAPDATEAMSYGMPTFKLGGNLVHFAGWAKHLGLYPTASGTAAFAKRLAKYTFAKGSVQFPHDEPLPLKLIGDLVKFRVKEVKAKQVKKVKVKQLKVKKPAPQTKRRR